MSKVAPYTNGVNTWQRWMSVLIPAIAGLGTAGTLFYQLANVAFQVNSNMASNAAISTRMDIIVSDVVKLQRDNEQQKAALNEIETQFCGNDIVRNLMHANDMRLQSMLWKKVFDNPLPTDNAYYPIICNRKTVP